MAYKKVTSHPAAKGGTARVHCVDLQAEYRQEGYVTTVTAVCGKDIVLPRTMSFRAVDCQACLKLVQQLIAGSG